MKLHDPETEKELMRIARNMVGPEGFLKSDWAFWPRFCRYALISLAVIYVLSILFALVADSYIDHMIRDGLCAIVMMYLARMGLDRVAAAFQSAGFFGTLANLPIRGSTALIHIRGVIFRRFGFIPLIACFVAAIIVHYPFDPEATPHVAATWAMLTAIAWATPGILQVGWAHRLRRVKIWRWAGYCVIGHLFILYFLDARSLAPQAALAAMDQFILGILWLFPPAWVFPERAANGGLIPAAIWIAWGAWSWIRWPARMFPGYDRPHDFIGAFGGVGTAGEQRESAPETASDDGPVLPEAAPLPPANGWVDRIIRASIPASDHAVAGSFMAEKSHTRAVNATMVFAVVWLLIIGFAKNTEMAWPFLALMFGASWLLPAIIFALALLPLGNPVKSAIRPSPAGNTPVPLFTMLPVTLRSLLRITLRIAAVRTVIAVAIATPVFWLLAKIHRMEDLGAVIVAVIPAVGIAWIHSVPAILANQLDPHLKRRKGIFPLILATSLVQTPIYVLWIIAAVAGIGISAAWGSGNGSGRYAFLLLPIALACLTLSAAMSWVIFEILHLSLRQRRYDWKSRIR